MVACPPSHARLSSLPPAALRSQRRHCRPPTRAISSSVFGLLAYAPLTSTCWPGTSGTRSPWSPDMNLSAKLSQSARTPLPVAGSALVTMWRWRCCCHATPAHDAGKAGTTSAKLMIPPAGFPADVNTESISPQRWNRASGVDMPNTSMFHRRPLCTRCRPPSPGIPRCWLNHSPSPAAPSPAPASVWEKVWSSSGQVRWDCWLSQPPVLPALAGSLSPAPGPAGWSWRNGLAPMPPSTRRR